MGSQILRGVPAEPIAWELLGGGVSQGRAQGAQAAVETRSPGDAEFEQLRARLAAAERDAAAREQRARAEGYAEGEAAGRAAEAARVKEAAARLAGAAAQLSATRKKMRRDAEEDCVRLATAIARRILRRELALDPDALLGIVKAALDRLEGREVERLRLNPGDASALATSLENIAGGGALTIVSDASLEPGACILETARGSLDASVETQLREIERGLVDRIR